MKSKNKFRKGVFVVVYSLSKVDGKRKKIEYLILKRKLHWKGWEFVKGGVKKGEFLLKTVKRESFEESGLRIFNVKRYSYSGKYRYDKVFDERKGFIGQSFVLYSAETKRGRVRLDGKEHSNHKWMNFKGAYKKLRWPNQKRALKMVDKFLNGRK